MSRLRAEPSLLSSMPGFYGRRRQVFRAILESHMSKAKTACQILCAGAMISLGSPSISGELSLVEQYADSAAKWGLDFNCQDVKRPGVFITRKDTDGEDDEALADAVAEGFCAGFIVGVVQMLNNIDTGLVSPGAVDDICFDGKSLSHRQVADKLADVAGGAFSARVVKSLKENYPCS